MTLFGHLERFPQFPSHFVAPRQVDVWLPPDYEAQPKARFPVLYMHDGQNLFRPSEAFIGVAWEMDKAMQRLLTEGKVPAVIIVGIWNTAMRRQEYLPAKPFASPRGQQVLAQLDASFGQQPLSDPYLRFLVEEVKPYVDRTYRTQATREQTWIMGSSMGGLISLYAVCQYPHVFAGAGCLSTHWVVGEGFLVESLPAMLPPAGQHKVYFDYGTQTLDAEYEPYQQRVDTIMENAGYLRGKNWVTYKFEGDEHSERAWQKRVHIPLEFLLNKGGDH